MKTRLLIFALLLLPLSVCSQTKPKAWFKIHFKNPKQEFVTFYFDKTIKLSLYEPVPTEVEDRNQNIYKVGEVGGKYWTLSNLLATNYDYPEGHALYGKSVPQATEDSIYEPYCYKENGECLYNWSAATGMKSTEETGKDAKIQGICPKKFHIPSAKEVNDLSGSQGNGGSNTLRSDSGWYTDNQFITQGNNDTGFNATAAGYAKGNENKDKGYIASFWTSYSMSDYSGYSYQMHGSGSLSLASEDLKLGRSVRCVWDGQTDWDYLYVYEEGVPTKDIKKYLISDISYIETGDDTTVTMKTDGHVYPAIRFLTTFWTTENLQGAKKLPSCGESDGSYFYSASEVLSGSGVICPDGWRLPTTQDFRQIMSQYPTVDIALMLKATPVSASYNGENAFSYGVESMFWVSDAKWGVKYSYDRSEQINYLDNIPYIDSYDSKNPRAGLISIENSMPALPVRCVMNMEEPAFKATNSSGEAQYGVWTQWNPRITFDLNENLKKIIINGEKYDSVFPIN